jgi:predicted nucleic acid-binding protein
MPRPAAGGANGKRWSDPLIDSASGLGNELGSARTYMHGPDFLDTNVLVYAYGASNPAKQQIAQDLVRRAVAGEIVTSTQVLAEFAATLLHQLSPAACSADVLAILDALGPIRAIGADGDTVRRAVEAHAQYGVHFYDGMILAAAERGACTRILSEDFNTGQSYFGIKVENPFV